MITMDGFTKVFGEVKALDAISFEVMEGTIFGLIGSNGSGKSTLLRSISGVHRPDGGSITIDGEEPYENPLVKQRVCFVSDYPYFMSQYTMKNMARFYRRFYVHWSEEEYDRLRGLFSIDENARLESLSKGMQRQAALICALASMPDYLLLDEVFDGLDPVMRQLLKRVISEQVSERDMTVMIASHNLRELEDFCDHVGLLHKGGIVFEQELEALRLSIHKVQAIFQPVLTEEELEAMKQELDVVKLEKHGSLISIVARCSEEQARQWLDERHPVFSETLPLTLEEVFISEMEAAGYDIDKILA